MGLDHLNVYKESNYSSLGKSILPNEKVLITHLGPDCTGELLKNLSGLLLTWMINCNFND